jgi:hypothetical protein
LEICDYLSAAQPGECLKIVQMSLFPYFLHVVAARYTQQQKQKMPGSQTSVVAAKVNRRQLPATSQGEREREKKKIIMHCSGRAKASISCIQAPTQAQTHLVQDELLFFAP